MKFYFHINSINKFYIIICSQYIDLYLFDQTGMRSRVRTVKKVSALFLRLRLALSFFSQAAGHPYCEDTQEL